MQVDGSNPHQTPDLPFVGRTNETALLEKLHGAGRHVLISGVAGVGKSRLASRLAEKLKLLVCPQSQHLGSICDSLGVQLGRDEISLRLPERKHRLRQSLAESGRTVIFDGVSWTTPKLSSFFECVMGSVPVWICVRSERPWDIGHFWPLLVKFEKLEVRPFRLAETHQFVSAAIKDGRIGREAINIANWLHHRSKGNPSLLSGLLQTLGSGSYDLRNPRALRRLDLDRRIHDVFHVHWSKDRRST